MNVPFLILADDLDRPLSAHEQQDRMFGGSSEPYSQHRSMTPTDRPDSERKRFVALLEQNVTDAASRSADTWLMEWMPAILAAFDAARTPLDQPEAVAWQMELREGWKECSRQTHEWLLAGNAFNATRALGVLPFTASPDRVRREALEDAARVVENIASAMQEPDCVFDAAQRIRALAKKGQS